MARIMAEGVGIMMPEISSLARDRPLAWMMRRRNSARIWDWAGSMFSWPNRGMTFSQTKVSRPSRYRWHWRAAERLPAMTTGKSRLQAESILALFRMVAVLPPSVPPTSRKMSGFSASISSTSSSVRS